MTSMRLTIVALAALLSACGDGGGATPDASAHLPDASAHQPDAAPGAPDAAVPGTFVLSSTAIMTGVLLADQYTCRGVNISPPLAWTAGPAATKSYAVVFTDLSNGLVHSVIWDIPGATRALPEHVENAATPAVPAGAKQARGYDESTFGYLGPCPGEVHTYRFELFALDVATMPGLTPQSSRDEVVPALTSHKLATTKLEVMSD